MKTGTFGPKEWDEPCNTASPCRTSQQAELKRHETNKTKWERRAKRWDAYKTRIAQCPGCSILIINNVVTHEEGCPTQRKK